VIDEERIAAALKAMAEASTEDTRLVKQRGEIAARHNEARKAIVHELALSVMDTWRRAQQLGDITWREIGNECGRIEYAGKETEK
jgi:hypothetical protein